MEEQQEASPNEEWQLTDEGETETQILSAGS